MQFETVDVPMKTWTKTGKKIIN